MVYNTAEMNDVITIHVNGQPREITLGETVAGLIQRLDLTPDRIAVERNRALVRRTTYADVRLEPGDQLEIVTLVGGG